MLIKFIRSRPLIRAIRTINLNPILASTAPITKKYSEITTGLSTIIKDIKIPSITSSNLNKIMIS